MNTPADGGTWLLRGVLAVLAACGLHDGTGGVRQRVQLRAAAVSRADPTIRVLRG